MATKTRRTSALRRTVKVTLPEITEVTNFATIPENETTLQKRVRQLGCKSYNFTVGNENDVDFTRIVIENPGQDFLIVCGRYPAVLAREEILNQYVEGDYLTLAGKPVVKNWGFPGLYVTNSSRSAVGFAVCMVDTLPTGWRCTTIMMDQLPHVIREIRRIKKYVRRLRTDVIIVE